MELQGFLVGFAGPRTQEHDQPFALSRLLLLPENRAGGVPAGRNEIETEHHKGQQSKGNHHRPDRSKPVVSQQLQQQVIARAGEDVHQHRPKDEQDRGPRIKEQRKRS